MRRFTAVAIFALASLTCLVSARRASAEPSLADRETARTLMEDGDTKREKNDLRGALKSYEAADALMHVPTTGLEVARAQADLGLLLEARETLGRVLRVRTRANEPAPFTAARKAAEQLNADLAPRLPSLVVAVAGADARAAAQVTVDGDAVPPSAADVPRKMNPGPHVVVVRSGGVERRQDITLQEREVKRIVVDLAASPPIASRHAPDDGTQARIDAGNSLRPILIYGGFGLAGAGVAAGTITGLMSLSKVRSVESACEGKSCPPDRQGDIDAAQTLGTVSTAAFIAAGAGIAAGLVGVLVLAPPATHDTTSALTVRAVATPGYAGMAGTF